MKHQLKLWKVIIFGPNPYTQNFIPRTEVIMLDVDEHAVATNARLQMGYNQNARTEVTELTGPFDSGYLITFKQLTDDPAPVAITGQSKPASQKALDVIDEFDALFKG